MNIKRWHKLMNTLNVSENNDTFFMLQKAYSEPHRFYHNAKHIDDCLYWLDKASFIAKRPWEIEIALWFHDAIYLPLSTRNEIKSSRLAINFLILIGSSSERNIRVNYFIAYTKHEAYPIFGDNALMVDIDLTILGSNPEEYKIYEDNIRKEYIDVPSSIYKPKRIDILQSFLNRPSIYNTAYFSGLLENQARKNLEWAIIYLYESE